MGRRKVELRAASLPTIGPGEALVETLWSSLSRGTERLVFEGRVPASEHERMRAPMQEGDFPFPVKYGYSVVGRVAEGPREWLGLNVFALHPHQDRFVAPVSALIPIPDDIPPRRAALAANMETALNALWDSGAGPGDRIAVIGGGVVGLLLTFLAAQLPGAEVTLFDVLDRRREAEAFGAAYISPSHIPASCENSDVVFHTSATAQGLHTALHLAGQEANIVEMSWYGDAEVSAPFGQAFHSKRLRLISSQVGHVAAGHRARWSHSRRLAKAIDLLRDARLDILLPDEVAFDDVPEQITQILSPQAVGLTSLVRY
ncbi:dehydrogenase [Methylovirgula sp. 4M-Z18]|nr:dehydrogenase [Methylovirgula sp. 4M-Z18]